MSPVAFSIFSIDIYWYGIAYVFGFLAGEQLSKFYAQKYSLNLKKAEIDQCLTYLVIGVLVGGRIGCFLFYEYTLWTIEIFKFRNGGMSFHGGLIGGFVSLLLFAKRYHKNIWTLSDLVAVTAPIGIFFGRLANYINDEIPGYVEFLEFQYSTVLLEALFEGIFLFVFLNRSPSLKTPKISSIKFLVYYAFFRFFLEFSKPELRIFQLNMAQWLCIGMLIYAIYLHSTTK